MRRQTTAYVTANAMMILANANYNCLPEWLISPILAFGIMLGGLVVMPIKPVAQKTDLRPSAQLSASEVQAFLDANLDSASPCWTARVSEIMQRPVAMPHLVFAVGVVFVVGVLFGVR
jgi:hypothetical protein